MKGKKADLEFLSQFISECIEQGLQTPDEFVTRASILVKEIDEEIKRVEKQKIIRSKLLDVILNFEKPSKVGKQEQIKILPFFQIQYPHICREICELVKSQVTTLDDLPKDKYSNIDILFCVKQLIEHKIIAKSGAHLLRSDKFEDYLAFLHL
jgi:hypothetical protein